MDPLSDMLSLVRPRNYGSGGLTSGGRWAVAFPAHDGIKCYVIMKGECFVVLDGAKKPVRLSTGDCLMLPHGRPFRLCSDLRARAVDIRTLFAGDAIGPYNGVRSIAPGDDFLLIGGHFGLEGDAQILLRVLPPLVHLKKGVSEGSLRAPIEQILEEMKTPKPGGLLIAQQSAYTMLVLVLRMYLTRGARAGIGWLFALADPQMARAIASMHERIGQDWTVQKLAETAGMSRTTFSQHFLRTVGESPMAYLTRLRMLVAGDRLRRSSTPVSEIANAVGYESESAFSAAFRRTMGESPRAYARGRRTT